MREKKHEADVCVVGGGMAGLTAALAAARHGAKVVLMHDRPVLGGNASSECRVHICGADRHNSLKNMRETGILEELRLENLARNPNRNFSVWDTVLYEKAVFQPGLTLLLNCSCRAARMDGRRIASVTGWQLTTETSHTVEAAVFIDCSGDGILAPLSGAEHRIGREAREEYGESSAPAVADSKTMGMTCLFQARPYESPQPFRPPAWAWRFDRCEDLPGGRAWHRHFGMGYWWVELGGEYDSIHDTEMLRHELLRIVFGVWDHLKNRCENRKAAENWALDWVQFLPAKRESRRYVGAHVLTQNDLESEGRFPDLVAYGGWEMDDHHPAGFWCTKHDAASTTWHKTPSPYGIPYRSLYSKNIENLLFAGRCASATHMAMSSTRVMGTGCSMGQAAGTAAAMAASAGVVPAAVGDSIRELQQALLRDDAYLPWTPRRFGPLVTDADLSASSGDPAPLRDGIARPVGGETHAWPCRPGDWVAYALPAPKRVETAAVVLNSALDKNVQLSYHQKDDQLDRVPPEMQKAFHLDVRTGGVWRTIARVTENHQRLVRLEVGQSVEAVRWVLDETWGAPETRLFALDLE